MATFFYVCRKDTEIKEGYMEANSPSEVSAKLSRKGYTILRIEEQLTSENNINLFDDITPLNLKEKKDFYTSFYKQYKSGISLLDIFNIIITTASTNNIRSIAFKISKRLQKGDLIDDVFSDYSKYIGKTESVLIITGNNSGTLENVLEKISEQIKEEEKIKAELISKLIYPAVLFSLLIFVILVFVFFFMPVFDNMLARKDVCLGSLLVSALIKIAISIAIIIYLICLIKNNKEIQKFFTDIFYKTKIIKEVLKNYYFSNFFTTFSLAYEAGLSPAESIDLSNKVIKFQNINSKIEEAQNLIKEGCEITTALSATGVFNDYTISQITTGEKSGKITQALKDVAQDYKNAYMLKIDALVKLTEPTILIIAGIAITILGVQISTKYLSSILQIM